MDYLYIEKCVSEVDRVLKKRRLSELYLEQERKALSIKFGELYLNAYFGAPNAFFLSKEPIASSPFRRLSSLKGAYFKSATMPYPDRVVEVSLVKLHSPTSFSKLSLVFELTGKNANFFLLSQDRKLLFIMRQVKSSVRELSLKGGYTPPPIEKKPFEELNFGEVTPRGIEKSLYKYALYLSPLNCKEIACLYREVGELSRAYELFMEKHRNSDCSYLYYENGRPTYLTTFPYCSLKGLSFKEFCGDLPYSRAWEEFYREGLLKEEVKKLKEKLLSSLRKRREALLKELEELSRSRELLTEAEELKRLGELLKYNLSLVKPGQEEVELFDYERGQRVKVPLEPGLSPLKNVELLFKKYRKLKRKALQAEERVAKLKEEIDSLLVLERAISEVDELEKLKELVEELGRKGEGERFSLKSFTLPSGKKLIVGRSARENELISLKLSNPWDYWFHAKDIPGSHVILKLSKGEEPTEDELLLAASAAAYFSKGRSSGKLPVDYTRVKNLKKPPKTPRGFVTYSGEKTVWVKPEFFEEFLKKGE